VLVASDFSDDARNAHARAARLAAEHRARLDLLHVISAPALAALRSLVQGSADPEAGLLAETGWALKQEAEAIAASAGVATSCRARMRYSLIRVISNQ